MTVEHYDVFVLLEVNRTSSWFRTFCFTLVILLPYRFLLQATQQHT